jgi:ATP-dependent protease ClpP protease subunit
MIHQPSGGAQGVATDMEINLEKCWNWKMSSTSFHTTLDKLLTKCTKIQTWLDESDEAKRVRNDWWSREEDKNIVESQKSSSRT